MQKLNRRCVIGVLALTLLPFAATTGMAQEWSPKGNVEIVVGGEAGGAIDRTARLLQVLIQDTKALPDATVSVVNRPGAGQTAAAAYLAQHEGDANYLLLLAPSVVNSAITGGLGKPYAEVTPIVKVFDGPLVFVTGTGSGISSIEDLIAKMKTSTNSVSFAFSTSAGNTTHVALAQLASHLGGKPTDLRIVVNASGSVSATQAAGGHVDIAVTSVGSAKALVDAGKVKIIGVAGADRLPDLPDVPTFREKGYDVIAPSWYAFAAPKGVTPQQVAFWNQFISKIMQSDAAKKAARENSWTVQVIGSDKIVAFLDSEWDSQRKALVDLGLVKP